MDVYRRLLRRGASERELVLVGRLATATALVVAACVAPAVAKRGDIFKFIQDYSGFVFPGVLAIFLFGLFWKRITSDAALAVVLLTIPLSAAYRFLIPGTGFLNRMMLTFLTLSLVLVVVSLLSRPGGEEKRAVFPRDVSLRTTALFNAGALAVLGIVAALYLYFW
jgi:SSS family solute:Na+ symporter